MFHYYRSSLWEDSARRKGGENTEKREVEHLEVVEMRVSADLVRNWQEEGEK